MLWAIASPTHEAGRTTCLWVMTGGYNSRRRIHTMPLSRRDFLASSALALGAGAFGQPVLARAWQQPPTPAQPPQQAPQWTPVFTEIRRGVGQYLGRGGTIGYLINAAGVVVVDS